MTRKIITSIVFTLALAFGLVGCGDADDSTTETEPSASTEVISSPAPQPESVASSQPTVVITNDGLTPEGSPQVTVTTNVKIDLVVGAPETDSEPVEQDPGTQSYPLYPAPELGKSLTWVVVALDPETGEVLGEETFTWTREE